jgi:DNA repair exonuclease SbcCD nuclease subunit
MPSSIRTLLHTSDLHLGNLQGEPGDSPAHLGLMRVVDEARAGNVDALLIAGDLFDSNRVDQRCVEFVYAQLRRLTCPVVIIPGNHDCFTEDSIFRRFDPADAGGRVHLLTSEEGETLELTELQLRIWGRGIVDHHPGNQPMAGVPDRVGDAWHVGLTHGYYVGRGPYAYSSLITADEIGSADLDYLALGHVHAYAEVSQGGTCAAYSGSPSHGYGVAGGTAAWVTLHPERGASVLPLQLVRN